MPHDIKPDTIHIHAFLEDVRTRRLATDDDIIQAQQVATRQGVSLKLELNSPDVADRLRSFYKGGFNGLPVTLSVF
ncbi:MAG: hypothetical protein WAX89_04090 [Alphaproteobacteria bacterium]